MDYQLLITFIVLNIINVIIQTTKSLCTIKCGKLGASIVNAIAYGFYTIVIVYTVCDLPLSWKVIIVALCNLIGVFVVKLIEEKSTKDKLWKIELTIPNDQADQMREELKHFDIPNSYIKDLGKWTLFNCYCATQKESAFVKEIANRHNAKYFVAESKVL